MKKQHVLVVFPHPDDETFGCGGTIAQFAKSGVPVTYVCGTLGEMGRNMGRPIFATRESLARVREVELEEACQALGISHLIKLGLRDKTVEFQDLATLSDRIEGIIREVRPSLVLTHYPGYAVHPDHNALGEVTVRAISRLNSNERPTVYVHGFPHIEIGSPDILNDISAVADMKLAATRAHRSQSESMLKLLESERVKDGALANIAPTFLLRESFWTYRIDNGFN